MFSSNRFCGCIHIPTAILAGIRATTPSHAVCAPLLADVKGQCLRKLGNVGGDVVLADAAVCQGGGVAVVGERGHRGHARLLQADEWADGFLVVAPVVWFVLE